MKKINEEFLQNYLSSLKFKQYGVTTCLTSCYKIFTTLEVQTLEDLKNSPINYRNFLMRNLHILKEQTNKSREAVIDDIEFFTKSLKGKMGTYLTQAVEEYANIVKDLFPNHKNTHILDVGAAFIPYSAFLEGEAFDKVSAMDYNFLLPDETMQVLNVNAIHSLFDKDTPVSQYDIVVGKQPCTAIKHMVKNCKDENKPYFIQLCNCDLLGRYYDDYDYGWDDVLPFIDPNVKIYGDYAFNLDASEDQVKKIIEKYTPKPLPKYKVPTKEEVKEKLMFETSTSFFEEQISPAEICEKPLDENEFLKMEMFERG